MARQKSIPPGWLIRGYLMFNRLPMWQCVKYTKGGYIGCWGIASKRIAIRKARKIEANLRRNLDPYKDVINAR